jgi:hypothetical protein
LAGIATVEAANAWLRDTDIPMHNAWFATKAEQDGSAFVAAAGLDLTRLCASSKNALSATTEPGLHIPETKPGCGRPWKKQQAATTPVTVESLAKGFRPKEWTRCVLRDSTRGQ